MSDSIISGGDKLEQHLRELSEKLSKSATLRVGFLEGATHEDFPYPVATLAAIHEFGAPNAGIPPRPFMRTTVADHAGEWGGQLATALKMHDYDPDAALSVMGEVIRGEIKEAISEVTDPPLKPATIARKGNAKPLIDSGAMQQAVGFEVK